MERFGKVEDLNKITGNSTEIKSSQIDNNLSNAKSEINNDTTLMTNPFLINLNSKINETKTDTSEKIENNDTNNNKNLFISYQWNIKPDVIRLEENLKSLKHSVWRDDHELVPGDDLEARIAVAINNSKLVICCITEAYCKSINCNLEFKYAHNIKKPMIVLMIEYMSPDNICKIIKADGSACGIGFILA